ncbi:MAG: hypothetical protein CM1200mP38_4340 [Dehalococcoidia bacterium]|nr:MAG: hypothetical protein CM1200mP38_4340 [Dehalococcoidia bacterium]
MATNTQRIAIVGVDESDQIGRVENKSHYNIMLKQLSMLWKMPDLK